MKDKIIQKLEKYANFLLEKEENTNKEIEFLTFYLQRIECKEAQEETKKQQEEDRKKMAEKMKNMFEGGL